MLVDRIWPRGLTREAAQVDEWLKDIDPSTALRKWFGHDPEKWKEFMRRDFRELDPNPAAVAQLRALAHGRRVTPLFAAKDIEHNNAVALKVYLGRRKKGQGGHAVPTRAQPGEVMCSRDGAQRHVGLSCMRRNSLRSLRPTWLAEHA